MAISGAFLLLAISLRLRRMGIYTDELATILPLPFYIKSTQNVTGNTVREFIKPFMYRWNLRTMEFFYGG